MCGIAGIFAVPGALENANEPTVTRMSDALRRRGPDDGGSWSDAAAGVALGHRRLSILDLSSAGHQPMCSHSGRFIIALNGEIYNHLELRRTLDAPWRGTSDTETLLACLDTWGVTATLERVVGMFAFAVWDRVESCLYLARDRFGEKPLYYSLQKDALLFASELRALRAYPGFSASIDPDAVAFIARQNYVPAPYSIYSGVHKLIAGRWIRISAGDLSARRLPEPQPYWSVEHAARVGLENPFRGTLNDAVDEFDRLLQQSVTGQSLSDVPLGAFLSGGIDSSLVVSYLQSISKEPIRTFSIGVEDRELDESRFAAAVARHLETDHHEMLVTGAQALETVDRLYDVWDEPFADSSQIPTLLLCGFACRYVKVALSGDGGDELFLGYNHYRHLQRLWKARSLRHVRIPEVLTLASRAALRLNLIARGRDAAFVASLLAQPTPEAMVERYLDRNRGHGLSLDAPEAPKLLPDLQIPIALRASLRDASMYLPDDILVKVDRASMYHSLEARAPLLDHRIAEFAFTLPLEAKLTRNHGKRLLREALARKLPRRLFERRKQGFSVPIASWLRNELRDWAGDLINTNTMCSELLPMPAVRRLWEEHQRGVNNANHLWGILMLIQFAERH